MAHIQPHSPADPAYLRPASPDMALQGVLAGHQYRLAKDQEHLLDGHRRLVEAQARFGAVMNGRFPEHLVGVVSDRAYITELSAALMNTARKDWMTLENLRTEIPPHSGGSCGSWPKATTTTRSRSVRESVPQRFADTSRPS
jgi:hypothetical protein